MKISYGLWRGSRFFRRGTYMNTEREVTAEVYLPLTQGKVAVIDFDDFEKVRGMKWRARLDGNTYYARSGKAATLLHRFLLDAPKGLEVDHVDGDGLNNRRINLRLATRAENGRNRKAQKNSSGFKGVYWNKWAKQWKADVKVNGNKMFLGYFLCKEDAARAYDAAALKYFGEFARLNFPKENPNG